jgi:hypothetical protein
MRTAAQRPVPNGGAGMTLEILIALTLIGTAALTYTVLRGKRKSDHGERDEGER